MPSEICPVCENKFTTENKYSDSDSDSESHTYCISRRISEHISKRRRRPARTSTPLPTTSNNPQPCASDSVDDFFYQSWKNGLHCNDLTIIQEQQQEEQQEQQEQQQQQQQQQEQQQEQQQQQAQQPQQQQEQQQMPQTNENPQQPFCNVAQVVFVNTVILQPVFPPTFQQVGYLADGTLVLMPTYWSCSGLVI